MTRLVGTYEIDVVPFPDLDDTMVTLESAVFAVLADHGTIVANKVVEAGSTSIQLFDQDAWGEAQESFPISIGALG